MATLLEICAEIPTELVAVSEQVRKSEAKKRMTMTEKEIKRRQWVREAYREGKRQNRLGFGTTIARSICEFRKKNNVRITVLEYGDKMFNLGKGQSTKKKAKNSFSKEEAGTIGTHIKTMRFDGSRLTCVCKTRSYN